MAPFVAAMLSGELVWLTCAVAGLSTIAERFHWALVAIKYFGVVYLLFLAWQMWTSPVEIKERNLGTDARGLARMFFAGIAVTLGNPKIMLFYLALVPTIIDLDGMKLSHWFELTGTVLLVLSLVYAGYMALASRAHVLLRNSFAVRIANRTGTAVLGGAAAVMASRSTGDRGPSIDGVTEPGFEQGFVGGACSRIASTLPPGSHRCPAPGGM